MCEAGQVGGAVVDTLVTVINGVVDILIPGTDALTPWEHLGATLNGTPPFSYVAGIVEAMGTLFQSPAATPTISFNLPVYGGSATAPVAVNLVTLTQEAAPYRGIMAGFIILFGSMAIYAEIKGYLQPSQLSMPFQ
jgi:hypothetical protein